MDKINKEGIVFEQCVNIFLNESDLMTHWFKRLKENSDPCTHEDKTLYQDLHSRVLVKINDLIVKVKDIILDSSEESRKKILIFVENDLQEFEKKNVDVVISFKKFS